MKAFILAVLCVLWAQESNQHHHDGHKVAEVVLLSAGDQKEVGKIMMHYDGKETMISGQVTGLQAGLHGFHIHEKGDLSNKCVGAGGHFNPENKHHGAPSDEDRHVGDLGNIEAGHDGVAKVNLLDKLVALDGPHDVSGRAVVVHADPDDLGKGGHEDSLTTGHAGARVACGIIKIKSHH